MRIQRFFIPGSVLLAGLLVHTRALAQEQHLITIQSLNGHSFLPAYAIPSAASESTADLALGFAEADVPVGGPLGIANLTVGAFSPRAGAQVEIFHPLSVFFDMDGNLQVGLNGRSAAAFGGSAAYSFKIGALYEVIHDDNNILSAAMDFQHPRTLAFSPLDVVRGFAAGLRGGANPDFVTNEATSIWDPAARYEHAFNRAVGLKALLGVRFVSGTEDASSETQIQAGFGFDYDLNPSTNVPIGFGLNYLRHQMMTEGGTNTDLFTVSMFETYQPPFNIGFEFGTLRTQAASATVGILEAKAHFG